MHDVLTVLHAVSRFWDKCLALALLSEFPLSHVNYAAVVLRGPLVGHSGRWVALISKIRGGLAPRGAILQIWYHTKRPHVIFCCPMLLCIPLRTPLYANMALQHCTEIVVLAELDCPGLR